MSFAFREIFSSCCLLLLAALAVLIFFMASCSVQMPLANLTLL